MVVVVVLAAPWHGEGGDLTRRGRGWAWQSLWPASSSKRSAIPPTTLIRYLMLMRRHLLHSSMHAHARVHSTFSSVSTVWILCLRPYRHVLDPSTTMKKGATMMKQGCLRVGRTTTIRWTPSNTYKHARTHRPRHTYMFVSFFSNMESTRRCRLGALLRPASPQRRQCHPAPPLW